MNDAHKLSSPRPKPRPTRLMPLDSDFRRNDVFGLLLCLVAVCSIPPALAAERALDRAKSEIAFSVKQMGVAVSGRFQNFSAKIDLDPARPEAGSAHITVEVASISTGEEDADAEALAKPWLDGAGFPKASFQSRAIRALGGDRYEVNGTLSLRGKPREITVPLTLKTQADGSALASGEFAIQRTDFGIGGGEWNDSELVASDVLIRFRLTLAPP